MNRVLVIGVGNESRGDDAAGLLAARRIRTLDMLLVAVLESQGEPTELMDAWQGMDVVHLIDASAPEGQPGTIRRFEAHLAPLPTELGALSSHGIGLGTTIELARAMGTLPRRLIVYAIEGESFAHHAAPHPRVAGAARAVAERICASLTVSAPAAR